MADISSDRVILTTDTILTANTTLELENSYILAGNITVTLPNTNLVDGASIVVSKRQGTEPRIITLSGSGHMIRILNLETTDDLIYDEEVGLELFWRDSLLRWEV